MKKWLLILVVAALAGAVGFQLYRKVLKKEGLSPQRQGAPVSVVAAPVGEAPILDVGKFSGSLLPRASFTVSPKYGGRLERLYVDVGVTVRNGDLVATLEDDEEARQVEQAGAELEVAQANLEDARNALLLAEREHARVKTLVEKGIASLAELDTVESDLRAKEVRSKVSLALVKQREATLKTAEVRLAEMRIRAIWSGGGGSRVVGERFVDEGALLKPNDPIVTVLDIGTLSAVIQVIEKDYPRIRAGQRAAVHTDLFPGSRFEAKVTTVAPFLSREARQAEAWIEVPNGDGRLKPGMFVSVEVEYSRAERARTVPETALARRNGDRGVFLLEEGNGTTRVRFIPLRLGISYDGRVEVLDPPISGMVVTLGHHLLEDGAPVRVSAGPAGEAGR